MFKFGHNIVFTGSSSVLEHPPTIQGGAQVQLINEKGGDVVKEEI